jgi:hypothetical protein
MPITQFEVERLDSLVKKLVELSAPLPPGHSLWYRGVSCSHYELLPKLLRDGKTYEQVFEREKRLLTRFRQRSVPYWSKELPQDDWDHLFAMQHYGIPTRLLDFSENAFVAAHFAISGDSSSHEHEGPCIPAIWCLDPVAWNRAMPMLSEFGEAVHVLTTADDDLEAYRPNTSKKRYKSPVALFGAHNSARIVAQRGTFMVWGSDVRSAETIANEGSGTLYKLRLTAPRDQLQSELTYLGFGETMIFPELASLGAELSRSEGWR